MLKIPLVKVEAFLQLAQHPRIFNGHSMLHYTGSFIMMQQLFHACGAISQGFVP